jgi:hypothetical protein
MIKLNTPYHVAEENVTVTFTELKNGGIAGTYPNATLTGTLEGNVLSATFHNTAVNAVGLIELTFNENSFEGKWKNGLEPGPMRGKWSGECLSDSAKDSSGPATLTPDQLKWIETKDSWDYEEAPKEWLDSKDFILAAMKKDESILEYVSENLKDDKELILAAVSVNGGTLQYASDKCKDEKELVLAALSTDGSALEYASDRLKEDREVVLAAVSNYGGAIEYAPDTFKADKDIVSAAVLNEGCSLEYVTEEFKNDKSIVMLAVSNNGYSLQYASDKLKEDKEIVMAAIAKDGGPLNYASEKLRNDKEVVIASLANDAKALEYASGNLRRDKEVLEAAIKNDASLAYLLNENLSEEQKLYLEEGVTLEDFDEEYQGGDDGKVAWMKDRNFVLEALRQDERILKHASTELKADRELVLEAIKQDINAIDYADEKLQSDPELLIARIILHFKGNENIVISDEDFNAFLGHGESYDTLDLIEYLLFKVEYIVLKNKKDEFANFDKKLFEFVNAHRECFWLLKAVSVRLAKIERLAEASETNFTQEQYDNVSELANYFRNHLFTKLDFAPSIEFETYFNDSEIDRNWEDCKWTSNADEEGLYFSEFIMEKTGMEWDKESWDDAKFYNHAISRIWVGLLNYSSRHIDEGFDEENGAICLHSVVNEYYAPIQDSGCGVYGVNTFRTITEYFLDIPKNDYDLNETDREDLEQYSGWQFDLRKVAHDMLNRNLFDYWPGASEFAK